MKKILPILFGMGIVFLLLPNHAFAAENADIASYSSDILNILVLIGSLFAAIFLVKGGYSYMTSSGNPEALKAAKSTIKDALIGFAFVVGASTLSAILSHAFNAPINPGNGSAISMTPIQPVPPQSGLAQVLLDSFVSVLQNIVQSATKPLVDGIISMLTTTPSVVNNSVVFNFWLVILGITDSLFALMIALLGFRIMSASSIGFEEIDVKQVLSRIVLAFLGANISIFLVDRIITLCNTMISAVLKATGGISQAWVLNAFDPANILNNQSIALITLIFMLLFVILSVVLLLYYINRLIIISLGAVLSPIVFLMWVHPSTSDFAKIAIKSYLVTVFTIFVHVVTIQLTASFLAVPGQSGTNSLISILVAVGLFFTLIKIPGGLAQMAFYTSMHGAFRKMGGQMINVISSSKKEVVSDSGGSGRNGSGQGQKKTHAQKVAI